jgi:nucleoredoxin
MRTRVFLRWWLGWVVAGRILGAAPSLPAEVTVTTPTKLEILTNGKPGGSIVLRAGERLTVVKADESHVFVRHRNLSGRVPVAHTDLPRAANPEELAVGPSSVAAPAPIERTAPAIAATVDRAASREVALPAGAIARVLAGKLVAAEGGGLQPRPDARLAGVRFFGIYFSAGWCGPCRRFTPELIDAYGKIRALYPEFEVIFVSRDKSAADMLAYMRDDRMPWPALQWDLVRGTREINRYAGSGIPCLVLVDAEGKVLSDSYRWGRYVGPDAVLDDTWKILRDHRRAQPRPKS